MLTGSSWMASTALPPLTGPPDDELDPDAGLVFGTPQAARAGDRTAAPPRRGTARRRVRRLTSVDIGFLRTKKRDDGQNEPRRGRLEGIAVGSLRLRTSRGPPARLAATTAGPR